MFEKLIRWLAKPFVNDLVKEELPKREEAPLQRRSTQKTLVPMPEIRGYYYECYRPLDRR